ncbi:hypothetical protein CMV_023590 [Castanea mollissima]|uniref:glutathione gamma-glutamylcysteinyltransferase n=1 Tax=Castanea mollissima TaxID=60419 RepID=A0A8J4QPQ9_9ROSI|nr:hypothetical protein CMV_023590 [Castanea mollissima]
MGWNLSKQLDLFMRLERGLDGSWAIVWSEVNAVGPNSLKPSKPIKLIHSGPSGPVKSSRVWRPCQNSKTLNPAHRQSFIPEAHDLGFRLKMPMEVQGPMGHVGSCSREKEVGHADGGSGSDGSCRWRFTTRVEDPGTGEVGVVSGGADKAITGAGEGQSGLSSPDTGSHLRRGLLGLGNTGDSVVSSELILNGPECMGLNPSEDLGIMLEDQLREGETAVEVVDSVGDFQAEPGLYILPREASGEVVSDCGSGENDNCVLDCEPLSLWAPPHPNVGTLSQTGTGHFSPIGGYHAGRDMVLMLDVARFKYPPHWVPLTLLWEAMDTIDEATGHRRGYMIISRHHRAPSILYTLIQGPEMAKKEEGTVGRNGAIKPTATKVKGNDMASGIVTDDTIPSAAVLILLPRPCLWIRIFTKRKRSKTIERKRVIKME